MPDAAAFLRAILDQPADDSLRLIFADWLEERGDPRAEFIRVQVELARLRPATGMFNQTFPGPAGDSSELMGEEKVRFDHLWTRQNQMLSRFEKTWLGDLHRLLKGWRFHRGFVDQAAMGARKFLENADAVFALAPIEHLKLSGGYRLVEEIGQSRWLARLRTLWLVSPSNRSMDDAAALALASSPFLKNLTWLIFDWSQIGDPGALALASSPHLPPTAYVSLIGNQLSPAGQAALQTRLGERVKYWRL